MDALRLVRQQPLRVLLLAAPLIFVAHFVEEGAGFVAWFNSHVSRGITEPLFWSVNSTALAITLAIVVLEWLDATSLSATLAVAWIGFLMLANALFHVTAAVVDGAYVPGLVTAVLLYVPFSLWFLSRVAQLERLSRAGVIVAAALGGLPMLAHGYLIIFRGSRLF